MTDGQLDATHIRRRIAENLESDKSAPPHANIAHSLFSAKHKTLSQPTWRSTTRKDKMKNAINRIPVVGTLIRYIVKLIMLPSRYYQTQRKVSVLKGQMNEVMQILAAHNQTPALGAVRHDLNNIDSRLAEINEELRENLRALENNFTAMREKMADVRAEMNGQISANLTHSAALQTQVITAQTHIQQIAADAQALSERQDTISAQVEAHSAALRYTELPVHVGPEPAETSGPVDLSAGYASLKRLVQNKVDENENDALYEGLQIVLRGREEGIRDRQQLYIESLSSTMRNRSLPILDIGCGRGEFLGILRDAGPSGVGIDINDAFVEHVRQAGLEAHSGDAIAYMDSLDDNSLGGITAFQVIEHVGFDYLQNLLKVAHSKLAPGGFILLETVNPYCLDTFKSFYLDPTHVKPIPKDLLTVTMIFYGFESPQSYWQSPVAARGELDPATHALYYQAYAVAAYKPA